MNKREAMLRSIEYLYPVVNLWYQEKCVGFQLRGNFDKRVQLVVSPLNDYLNTFGFKLSDYDMREVPMRNAAWNVFFADVPKD